MGGSKDISVELGYREMAEEREDNQIVPWKLGLCDNGSTHIGSNGFLCKRLFSGDGSDNLSTSPSVPHTVLTCSLSHLPRQMVSLGGRKENTA